MNHPHRPHRRKVLSRTVSMLLASLFLLFIADSGALACSCSMPPPAEVEFKRSSAVFVGEVESVDRQHLRQVGLIVTFAVSQVLDFFGIESTPEDYGALVRVKFKVIELFKGPERREIEVRTGLDEGDCGIAFERGQRVLVYASDFDGNLQTGMCSRGGAVELLQDEVDLLRDLSAGSKGRGSA